MRNQLVYSRLDGSGPRCLETGKTGAPVGGVRDGLPAARAGVPCTWVVCGEDVLLTRAALPMRSNVELERALPFALEEELAVDLDGLVFSHRRAADRQSVAVVGAADLETGLAALRAAGLQPRRILVDVLLLPIREDAWSVAVEGERALVRLDTDRGFACETANLAWSLRRAWDALDEDARPRQLLLAGVDREALELPAGIAVTGVGGELLPRLAEGLSAASGPELRPRRQAMRLARGSRVRWSVAAGLAALALLLAAAGNWWEARTLAAGNRGLQAQVEGVFGRSFPGRRIQDARLQMQQEIDRLERSAASEASLLPLLAALAGPFSREQGLRIRGIEYRQGQLALSLSGRDVAQLERLKQALESGAARRVEIGAVQAGKDGVRARLRIKGGAV